MSDTVFIIMEPAQDEYETVVQQAFRGRAGESTGWANLETELWQRAAKKSSKLKVISSVEYNPSIHRHAFYFIPVPNGNDFPAPVFLGLIPTATRDKLKAGRTPILISMALEYWPIHNVMSDVSLAFQAITSQLSAIGLQNNRALLLTLSKLPPDVLEDVESAINYQVTCKTAPLIIEWLLHGIQDNGIKIQSLKEAINHSKPKLFLNLNNHPRLNRTVFVNVAAMLAVLDMGIVSYVAPNWIPPLDSGTRFDLADKLVKSATLDDSLRLPDFLNSPGRISHRLKVDYDVANVPNPGLTAGLNWVINTAHYSQTLFSVVSETYGRNGGLDGVDNPMITEKTLKAIAMRHPFMIMGEPYSLRLLRSMGFLTYEELFDESYDEMPNVIDRAVLICQNVRSIHYDRDDFAKKLKSVAWKIEYNYNHLISMNVGDEIAKILLRWEEEIRAKVQ